LENLDKGNHYKFNAMARPSKYHNEKTNKSKNLAEELYKQVENLTTEEVERLQSEYGVSDVDLGSYLHLNRSIISLWKNGKRDITDYNKLTMYLFFKYIKEQFNGR
jgi:DNA-binding transcriptional regulator YiaG